MELLDELAVAARDGNRLAIDRFTELTIGDVERLCWHLGDPDVVDDLVQETYARMMRSLPGFRGDGSARGWLLRIARNTCADSARARQRSRRHVAHIEAPAVAAPPPAGWPEVTSMLQSLDPDRAKAFVLTQVLNLSYEDAAEVLEVPIGTIRSRVARARSDLVAASATEATG